MARLLDEPPVLQPGVLRGDTRLSQRWAHGGLNYDYMRGVAGHIAVGCHRGDHPISWCHAFEGGRSWYTGLGHDEAVYTDANFLQQLRAGLRYATGKSDDC